jgi:E3 ubiquitin-protein ligase RAD18
VQEWIIMWNSNLDTSHPQSLGALRAKLNQTEASRRRDKERGKDALGQQLGTKDGMDKYAKERKGEFERLRQEIMERDRRRAQADKGSGADSPIEVD